MIVTTTSTVEGHPVAEYLGIVTGEAILGANVFRDIFAGITDIIGGRSAAYERSLGEARDSNAPPGTGAPRMTCQGCARCARSACPRTRSRSCHTARTQESIPRTW